MLRVEQRNQKWVVVNSEGEIQSTVDSKAEAERVVYNYNKAQTKGAKPPMRHSSGK